MKNLLKSRLLLVIIVIIAIIFIGLRMKNNGGVGGIIPSIGNSKNKTVFVQVAKQFAVSIPAEWSITEPIDGRQTLVYPTGTEIGASDAKTLIDKGVIIIETAVNKKDSFDALIEELKTAAENDGSKVTVDNKKYGSLKASKLTVKGENDYQQIFFDTPTIIIVTSKINHSVFDDIAKSMTIDITKYADNITKATDLTQQTRLDITSSNYSNIYKSSSENLKGQKSEAEFSDLLDNVSADFDNNVVVWGVYINANKGLGTAANILEGDIIIRRSSFYYTIENDNYLLDAMRVSGRIKPADADNTDNTEGAETPATNE